MKRKDLQGLRGYAIIAVVLFHFLPNICPSGYLGVDLFFVLSGYLITTILAKSEISLKVLSQFYYRRIKRIIPLYYLITCLIASVILYILPLTFLIANKDSFWRSLLFISNMDKPNEMNYFAELDHAKNLFTHTWSLSVEIQYYLLTPFIYYTIIKTPYYLHMPLFSVICILSITYQSTTDSNTAFNSVFARIWQFTIGSIACLKSAQKNIKNKKINNDEECLLISHKKEVESEDFDTEHTAHTISSFVVFLLFLISFGQSIEQISVLRLVSTCLTGLIILSGCFNQSILLTNPVIVYIGDISYSLYLVHWPISVCIENYYTDIVEAKVLGIISSFLLAIILKETYEKWYLQSNFFIIVSLILILAGINFTILIAAAPSISKYEKKNMVIWNENCHYKVKNMPLGWCIYDTGLNKSSPYTGFMIGNSYVGNLGGLVWENCGSKMNKLEQYGRAATHQHRNAGKSCTAEFANFLKFVEQEKPDYLFLLARWIDMALGTPNELDKELEAADIRMEKYSQFVGKKIFVLHGFPTPKVGFMSIYSKRYKIDKENARSDNLFSERMNYKLLRERLETLAKKYSKMVLIDIQPSLTINGTFRVADPSNGISYFTPDLHLSLHGTKAISSAFHHVCREL